MTSAYRLMDAFFMAVYVWIIKPLADFAVAAGILIAGALFVSLIVIPTQVYRKSTIFRPVRGLVLAYSYVLTGRKFDQPVAWSDI